MPPVSPARSGRLVPQRTVKTKHGDLMSRTFVLPNSSINPSSARKLPLKRSYRASPITHQNLGPVVPSGSLGSAQAASELHSPYTAFCTPNFIACGKILTCERCRLCRAVTIPPKHPQEYFHKPEVWTDLHSYHLLYMAAGPPHPGAALAAGPFVRCGSAGG